VKVKEPSNKQQANDCTKNLDLKPVTYKACKLSMTTDANSFTPSPSLLLIWGPGVNPRKIY
jgi:hypothetical protein